MHMQKLTCSLEHTPSGAVHALVRRAALAALLATLVACQTPQAMESASAKRYREHFVALQSSASSMPGEFAQLYVRERLAPARLSDDGKGQVVLFVHGAGTPAEVAFDVPHADYSWMAYLAGHGFAAYSMDMTGYGRSTRPTVMNDRCNLSVEHQQQLFGATCEPSFGSAATTMASDWDDIDAVVNFLREKHGVERVHLVAWSQGGPRAAGYAFKHPAKVGNMVLLAPAYNREAAATAEQAPIAGAAMTKQSRADFFAGWERQTGCEQQVDPEIAELIWQDMLASDPVGATWGDGVRRAPRTPTFGWTPREVAATQAPVLTVIGLLDAQVQPERAREFHADLGASNKVLLEMPCASHNAMWEKDAQHLYEASRQWLLDTSWQGHRSGSYVLE
jgi:pimeloyl-ACP methyl ester carboxylesterase